MEEIYLSKGIEKFKISSQFDRWVRFDCSVNSHFQENYGANLNEEEKTLTFSEKFFSPSRNLNFSFICNAEDTFINYELGITLVDGEYSFTFLRVTSLSILDFSFIISDLNSSFLKFGFGRNQFSFVKSEFCSIASIKSIGDFVRKLQSTSLILSNFKEIRSTSYDRVSFLLGVDRCEKYECFIVDGWIMNFWMDKQLIIEDIQSIPTEKDEYLKRFSEESDDYCDIIHSFEYKEYVLKYHTTTIKNKLSKDYTKREILILRECIESSASPLFRFISKIIRNR